MTDSEQKNRYAEIQDKKGAATNQEGLIKRI
jgi:hypothetical protein